MNEGLLLDAVRLSLQQPTSVFFQRLIMPDQFPIPTPAQEVHSPLQALRQLQPEHLLPRVRLTVGRELLVLHSLHGRLVPAPRQQLPKPLQHPGFTATAEQHHSDAELRSAPQLMLRFIQPHITRA